MELGVLFTKSRPLAVRVCAERKNLAVLQPFAVGMLVGSWPLAPQKAPKLFFLFFCCWQSVPARPENHGKNTYLIWQPFPLAYLSETDRTKKTKHPRSAKKTRNKIGINTLGAFLSPEFHAPQGSRSNMQPKKTLRPRHQ